MSKDKFNQSVSLNTLQSYTILLYIPKHLTLLTQIFFSALVSSISCIYHKPSSN